MGSCRVVECRGLGFRGRGKAKWKKSKGKF